jgi:hypothetical protein
VARHPLCVRLGQSLALHGALLTACVFVAMTWGRAAAQTPVPQPGLHYYAVENLNTGRIDQRGTTGTNAIAFSNLILAPETPYRIWILQLRRWRLPTRA